MNEVSDELRLLLEERAILRALHEYAHTMDYGDEAAWVDSFTPDAVFDVFHPDTGEKIHREDGHGDLARYVAHYPKPPAFRKHCIVDPLIDVDGDTAHVRAYWILLQRDDTTSNPVLAAFGRYHDRMIKTGGKWRIAERIAEVESRQR